MEESLDEDKPTTSILPPHPEDAAEELPEWLREIDNPVAEGTSPVELAETEDTSEFPDWLKTYPTSASMDTPLAPIEAAPELEPIDEVPNWLQDMGSMQASEPSDLNLPDWLNDIQAAIEPVVSDVSDQPVVALPEWLVDEVPEVEQLEVAKLDQVDEFASTDVVLPESIVEEQVSDALDEITNPEVDLPVTEEAPTFVEDVVTETSGEIAEEELEEQFETPAEEMVSPIAEGGSWIPEQTEPETNAPEIEHSDWEMRVDRGTQALTLDETAESGSFAVPSDSILSDVSAAAAAAAIGIPLFAQSAGGTESLHNAEDKVTEEPAVEEKEVEPVDLSQSVDEVMVSDLVDEMMVSEAIDEVAVSEAIDEVMVSEPIDESIISDEVVERVEPIYTESEAESVEPELAAEAPLPEVSLAQETVSEEPSEEEPLFEETPELSEISDLEDDIQPEPVLEANPELPEDSELDEIFHTEPVLEAEPAPLMDIVAPTLVEATPVAEMDYQGIFDQASESLGTGDLTGSSAALSSIVQSEKMLPEVIQLVKGAIDKNPSEFSLWMVLGDAYGRSGELQKALDAYIKAEEYLH